MLFNKKKIKLSVVTIICVSLFLIALTITLSYTSINSTKHLGKHAITINKQSTRDNAKLFFLEITRRTAGEYSTYLNGIEDFVDILASQTKELLSGNIKKNLYSKEIIKLTKHETSDFYVQKDSIDYNCFYFGNNSGLDYAETQLQELLTIFPLIKAIYNENSVYFVCLWVQTANNIHIEYPRYYDYKNIKGESIRSYFKFIFSEFEDNKKNFPKAIWAKPYKDISGKINLDVYKFIHDDKGKFLASAGIDLNFDQLLNTLTNNSLFSDRHHSISKELRSTYNKMEGFVFITDRNGSIIVFPDKYSQTLSLPDLEYSKLREYPDKLEVNLKESMNPKIRDLAEEFKNSNLGTHNISLQNEDYIIAYSNIPTTDWILCFASQEKSLMSSIDETKQAISNTENKMVKKFIIIAILFLLLFIFIVAFFFRFYLLKPLNRIINKVKEIGEGNFNILLRESGFEEIADLAITFNNLTKELKNYTRNLEYEVKQRQSIETELEIAGKLQNSALPLITDEFINNKYELYAKLIPAKEMSGDFYDFFYINNNTLCLVTADVSGKGMTAAFYMSMAKAIIKEECLRTHSLDTGVVMTKINKILCKSVKTPMFITMYLVFYNTNTGKITYTNAGHHEYAIINDKGKVNFKGEAHNTFAGFFNDIEYSSSEFELAIGETLILYTDGITEACNKNKAIYEKQNLKKIIEHNTNKSLSDIGYAVIDDVIQFQQGIKFDDITLVMFNRK